MKNRNDEIMRTYSDEHGYVGLSDSKMKHMAVVAEQCYLIARDYYKIEEETVLQSSYLTGWLHDVGYAFSGLKGSSAHEEIGARLPLVKDTTIGEAIRTHGKALEDFSFYSVILRAADLSVNTKGEVIGPEKRIKDIGQRYGEDSSNYKVAQKSYQWLSTLPEIKKYFEDATDGKTSGLFGMKLCEKCGCLLTKDSKCLNCEDVKLDDI